MEDPINERDSTSVLFTTEDVAEGLNQLKPEKYLGLDFFQSCTLLRISSQTLVARCLHFLHAPTQNSQDVGEEH